jgi:hypothetical protein
VLRITQVKLMLVVEDTRKVAQLLKRNAASETIQPRDLDLGQLPGLALLLAVFLLLFV